MPARVPKGRKPAVFRAAFELASDKMPMLATLDLQNVDTVIAGHVSSTDAPASRTPNSLST